MSLLLIPATASANHQLLCTASVSSIRLWTLEGAAVATVGQAAAQVCGCEPALVPGWCRVVKGNRCTPLD
jgi:hypothetical protein